MVQAFVKEVFAGDKRIFLIDGEPVGVINRIPSGNDIRSNLAAGGSAAATELSDADLAICRAIGPTLKAVSYTHLDVYKRQVQNLKIFKKKPNPPLKNLRMKRRLRI